MHVCMHMYVFGVLRLGKTETIVLTNTDPRTIFLEECILSVIVIIILMLSHLSGVGLMSSIHETGMSVSLHTIFQTMEHECLEVAFVI